MQSVRLSPRISPTEFSQIAGAPGFFRALGARDGMESKMLWTIFVIILVLWLLGFSFHIAGGLIHILLVVALIVLVINLITGRRGY
jgi:uncharacterized membrane protein YtjA (UPF0391 family)